MVVAKSLTTRWRSARAGALSFRLAGANGSCQYVRVLRDCPDQLVTRVCPGGNDSTPSMIASCPYTAPCARKLSIADAAALGGTRSGPEASKVRISEAKRRPPEGGRAR